MARRKNRPAPKPSPQPRPRKALLDLALPELHPFRPRRDSVGLALLLVGAFALYAASTPRTVMLEDDGGFIATARFLGVGHAPGYPLFILLGWLATLCPVGSIAWRVHALSGLMGALACACVACIVLRRTGNRPAAYLAGAALAVSQHFWSQAIIGDVYTTNAAIVFLALALAQEAAARRQAPLWIAAATVWGLGLANHYPLLILASPVLLAPTVAAGRDFWKRVGYLIPIALLAAAALYAWMAWRSHQPTPINFFGPIAAWDQFVSFVNRSIYAGVDESVNAGLADRLQYWKHFAQQALLQFGAVGSLAALWGAFASYRTGWRLGLACETAAFAASSFGLIAMLGFDYEHLMIAALRPYPLVAYGILALWLGYGIHALTDGSDGRGRFAPRTCYAAAAVGVAALGLWNARVNFRPRDTFAADQAQMILDLVERDGTVVLYRDAFVGPLAYLRWVEGRRPDVRMLEAHGLLFSDRVVQPTWSPARRDGTWADFFRGAERPSYFQWSGAGIEEVGQVHLGFLRRADGRIAPGGIGVEFNDTAKQFFKKLMAMPEPADAWIYHQRGQLLETYGEFLGLVLASETPAHDAYIADVLPLAEDNYWSLMGLASALAPQTGDRAARLAERYLREAQQRVGGVRNPSKTQRATLAYLSGLVERRKGNLRRALELFQNSVRINRKPANPAYRALRELTASGAAPATTASEAPPPARQDLASPGLR